MAGILGRIDDRNRDALARMQAALVHRGPDDAGRWESPPDAENRGALLAFRRLAILDLAPTGAQPMVDPRTGHVLVFNGEVYNYRALRAGLETRGERFASTGDAAVVLRSIALDGTAALPRLRGMFALAAWDPRRRSLLLARDPLGIKPLYVARSRDPRGDWTLAFASELRALLASGLLGTPRLDPVAVASLAWNGFVVGPGTAVEGVELFPAGHVVEQGLAGAPGAPTRFWSLPPADGSRTTSPEALEHALAESVRLHLASDVPLGIFLSGGIDSSAVANLAHRADLGPVHTFTLSFEEEELDEGPAARAIADAIGTEHREIVLTEDAFRGRLGPALDSLDQPTFDGLNAWVLSHAVRDAGFTVALVGTGGDELFGGYGSFRDLPALHRWSRRLAFVPRALLVEGAQLAVAALQPDRGGMPRQTRWAKLPEMVRRGDDLLALYQLAYALFLPDFQDALVAGGRAGLVDGLPSATRVRLAEEARGRSDLASLAAWEQRLFLGERLLRDNDVASMAASLEQRLPLVDSELLATVWAMPDEARFQPVGRKEALRRAGLGGLDPALFDRPKRGFVLPFDRWIRQGLETSVDETLRDPELVRAAGLRPEAVLRLWRGFQAGAPGLYWSRLWAIYVLVRWCARNGVRAASA